MAENNGHTAPGGDQPYEPKRAKLDELFADEPYLSPTMKARRLHEKLNGFGSSTGPADLPPDPSARELPTEAWVPATRDLRDMREAPEPLAEPLACVDEVLTPDTSAQAVNFADATAFLRSTRGICPEPAMDPWAASRLLALRDSTLADWLRELR